MTNLKSIRLKNKYTQRKIAHYLGVTPAAYSFYESGTRSMPIECYIKLASYYKVTVDYLVGNSIMPDSLDKRLDPEYSEMVSLWNKLEKKQKLRALGYLEGLVGQQKNNKQNKTLTIIKGPDIINGPDDFDASSKKNSEFFEK